MLQSFLSAREMGQYTETKWHGWQPVHSWKTGQRKRSGTSLSLCQTDVEIQTHIYIAGSWLAGTGWALDQTTLSFYQNANMYFLHLKLVNKITKPDLTFLTDLFGKPLSKCVITLKTWVRILQEQLNKEANTILVIPVHLDFNLFKCLTEVTVKKKDVMPYFQRWLTLCLSPRTQQWCRPPLRQG